MLKQTSLSGKWKESGQEVFLSIPVILFKEDGCHFAYMPALEEKDAAAQNIGYAY